MALLFAIGLKPTQVEELMGYSISRVSVLRNNPAFDDLVEQKRGIDEAPLKEPMQVYNQLILENGIKAERKLADKLDDDDETEELSIRELISISRDSADRVGLSKRAIQTNVSVDFAAMLDRAILRSRDVKLIETASNINIETASPFKTETASPLASNSIIETATPLTNVRPFKRRM